MIERAELVKMLTTGSVTLEFTKLDGTERVMQCTLAEGVVPPTKVTPDTVQTATNKALANVVVYDTEKLGWRTVVLDRITKISA